MPQGIYMPNSHSIQYLQRYSHNGLARESLLSSPAENTGPGLHTFCSTGLTASFSPVAPEAPPGAAFQYSGLRCGVATRGGS